MAINSIARKKPKLKTQNFKNGGLPMNTNQSQKNFYKSDYQITILDNLIQDETGNKSLLFSTANLSLIRKNQMLTKNTKTVIEYETTYSEDGKPLMKRPIEFQVELSPTDLKALDEGIDKNAVTLEVAPRHANSQVNISNTNAVQNNLSVEWE